MNERSDRRLAWQPDIYQRYSFLARLTDILSDEGSGALTLLDVGSGPIALAEAFVSPRFDIVRADVSQFDDPSIVLLHPREPLPFEDAAFDVAVAIEVLEHVPPAQRPHLIRELQRVSRQATIVCCPIDTPEVVEAERQFSAYAKAVSGRDVDFLVEHRENGLPDAAEVVSWFSEPGSVLVADNAPLDEWLAFNTLDFSYAFDFGDDEAKGRFAAAVNTRAPLARSGAAHYRRFFCAFTSPALAATAARVIDAARSADPIEPKHLVRELVTGILGWRREWRERSTREVEAIQRNVGELDAALLRLKETVAEKDARLLELEANAKVAAEALARARVDVAVGVEQIAQLGKELRIILTSQSWRLTAPLRQFRKAFQRRSFITSPSWRSTTPIRRFKRALQQRTLIPGLRRRVRQRITRLRNYAGAGQRGLAGSVGPEEAFAPGTSSGRLPGYVPPQGRLPWFNPLNLVVAPQLVNEPRLNVLVPGLGMSHLSGGPNTALEIAGRLALSGVRVRLLSTEFALDKNPARFRAHMRGLLGTDLPADVQLVSADDRGVPLAIGARDLFMATAWWTAQQAKYAVRQTQHSRFVYLIQDYEPLFHPASTQQALAAETYSLDHLPVVNSQWLHEFLVRERIGRFADPAFAERSLVFQPAVDRTLFFPAIDRSARARRRLLFYARPNGGLRNLFELGVAALEKAVADGTLDPERWELLGMGESFPAVSLGRGATLVPAPWLDLASYAQQMRQSDILLSLMLSPHPSYPPLEMAACGGLAVTTTFANKTSKALADLSANIIGVPPTLEGISEGLEAAVARVDDVEARRAAAAINLPASWSSSMAEVVPRLFDELAVLQGSPVRESERSREDESTSIIAPAFRNWPRDEYEVHRLQAFARRRAQYPSRPERGLISLLTPVWNTPPEYLEALADSVLSQDADAGSFEWVVLDNGSDNSATRASLERVRRQRGVHFLQSERNLGIIEGTRLCFEHAVNRYTATVDHDDLLTPDCIRVVSHALGEAGYPALAYTDEDKLDGDRFSSPYLKPSFDPVLFANSCYIAHLSVVDRQLALQLGAYTDKQAEGSHDWDTFTRFLAAGHTALHIPEVLYSWRIHEASTSEGNLHSKPFVHDSQRYVLTKLLETLTPTGRFRVERPPVVTGMPDWWMRRNATDPRPVMSVVLGSSRHRPPRFELPKEIPHEVVHLDPADGVVGLARLAARAAESGCLLHVLWHDTRMVDDVWALEAMGLFELFPDTAIVGGRLHQNGRIVDAGAYFGFGRGCDAPDRDRPLEDPGYHAQAWKPHSVSAVPFDHCVLDPHFAANALNTLVPLGAPLDQLGPWLAAAARRLERRVVYTPFFSAMPAVDRRLNAAAVSRRAFVATHGDLMPDALLWPPHAGLKHGRPFRSPGADAVPGEPEDALSYDQALEADRLARDGSESPAARDVAFTLMTSVYARSPVEHFAAAIRSVLAQTHQRFEWILFQDGPVGAGVLALLDGLAREPRVRVIKGETCRGIQHGFRQCLEAATGEWIVPIDADDVVEADALAVMAATIAGTPADFVFSDEDHLVNGRLRSRYARPGFDPVLNIESSYIWHLSAFRRDRALSLGLYTDSAADYCHDWDTSTRFAQAGAVMVHVPHVLYHWRSHAASSSHSASQNPGTIASTRAVLERIVTGQSSPSHYEIAEYPIYRGAIEWWIRRRPIGDPSFGVVVLGADEREPAAAAACSSLARARTVVAIPGRIETVDDWRRLGEALPVDVAYGVVLGKQWRPEGEDWLWEAIKWFELQPDTAIVGGRLVDDNGIVVDAGLGRKEHRVLPVYRGLRRTDAGEFALALKAQTTHAPAEGFFVVERRFLEAAIESVARKGFTRPLGATLGALAKAQHRRVVYSPLVEARRIRVPADRASRVDDTFVAEEDSRLAQRSPNDGNPAPATLRLIAPTDWQHVGTRPEFKVRASNDRAGGGVLLYMRDDYFERGTEGAACVASVRLEPADEAGLLVGTPAAPLLEGDYVVALKGSTGNVLSVSGVCIRETKDRWPRRFQAMLEEQARFAVGTPASERPRREGEPLFSITTAVHDVDPAFLFALADSILSQRYDDLEWVLLDNGSRRPDTQQACRDLALRDPRVRFWRVEDNLHIIGGSRFLLEHARGTYVVPVDHDDVLYPDALRILSSFVAEHHEPDLLYSDEQKITLNGVASEILWRPAWSNLAALSTCPAAHVMVFKRTLALEADLYSGDYARGSPDWDSALRLATRTSHIVQVPFVLYGWRMHPGSTAVNEDSKNYLAESQKSVVRHALKRLDLADRFEVTHALDGLGYYHAVRRRQDGPRVLLHAVISSDAPLDALAELRSSLAHTRYEAISQRIYVPGQNGMGVGLAAAAGKIRIGGVKPDVVTYRDEADLLSLMFTGEAIESGEVHIVLNPMLAVTNTDWIWEAIGTFELDPSTGIVGGCILDPDGRIHHIGYVSGLDGFFATPAHGQDMRFVHGTGVIRRNVTAVYGSFMAVKRDVLRAIGGLKGIDRSDGLYGIELCLRAARHGIKTAYSPRMKATFVGQFAHPAGADRALVAQIVAEYPAAGAPDPYYSRHCIPRAGAFGSPIVE